MKISPAFVIQILPDPFDPVPHVGGTVFDPFTGSGTTAVVALENRRNFIGTELNPEYIKIAKARIKEEVPQTLEGVFE